MSFFANPDQRAALVRFGFLPPVDLLFKDAVWALEAQVPVSFEVGRIAGFWDAGCPMAGMLRLSAISGRGRARAYLALLTSFDPEDQFRFARTFVRTEVLDRSVGVDGLPVWSGNAGANDDFVISVLDLPNGVFEGACSSGRVFFRVSNGALFRLAGPIAAIAELAGDSLLESAAASRRALASAEDRALRTGLESDRGRVEFARTRAVKAGFWCSLVLGLPRVRLPFSRVGSGRVGLVRRGVEGQGRARERARSVA